MNLNCLKKNIYLSLCVCARARACMCACVRSTSLENFSVPFSWWISNSSIFEPRAEINTGSDCLGLSLRDLEVLS